MNVFVTGSRGFVGKNLVDSLIKDGYYVIALTRLSLKDKDNLQYICGDIRDSNGYREAVSKCQVIINCAGETKNVDKMYATHVEGTAELLRICREVAQEQKRIIHFIHLSSVGVYGPPLIANEERTVFENDPMKAFGVYETTKAKAEKLVQDFCLNSDSHLTYTVLRPTNIFAKTMTNNSLKQMVRLIKKRLFFFIGRVGAIATYIHVDDVVSAIKMCIDNKKAINEVFNVSNDCTFEEIVSSISSDLGVFPFRFPEKVVRCLVCMFQFYPKFPLTEGRINALVSRTRYSNDKITKRLGFVPMETVPSQIRDFCD